MTEKPYTDADVELVAGWFRRWLGASTIRQRDRDCAVEILSALAAAGRLAPTDDRHILQVDVTGWSLQHPMACRPDLLSCPVQLAAAPELAAARAKVRPVPPGRYEVFVSDLGDRLLIGDRVDQKEG